MSALEFPCPACGHICRIDPESPVATFDGPQDIPALRSMRPTERLKTRAITEGDIIECGECRTLIEVVPDGLKIVDRVNP